MKTILIILDGLGDRPIAKMGGRTPLQAADTPVLDWLAERSICGQLYALGMGLRPSSDAAHMKLLGVDYDTYYTGRGAIELYGLGKTMFDSDIAIRGNFAQVALDGTILDRRAKRQLPSQKILDELALITIDDVEFRLHSNIRHSFALQLTGPELSSKISDSDPHQEGVHAMKVRPLEESHQAKKTAELLNKYISHVGEFLMEEYQMARSKCNSILMRSASSRPIWFDFNEKYGFSSSCCIVNSALENGIGSLLGMERKNKKRYQNYQEYYHEIPKMMLEALDKNDFVFLHIQEPDLYGEDGNPQGKLQVIEEIDQTLRFLKKLNPKDHLVIITADHSTPCCLHAHSGDSVPMLVYGGENRKDDVSRFDEISCAKGGLGTVYGKDFMNMIQNFRGDAELIGG